AAHAASWAGLAPGNNQSGGKRRSGRTNKGNRWLRRALVQSAWAVSHKRNCFLTAQFHRRAARQGEKKAIVATAHQLLVIAFYILRDGTVYREKGGTYFDQLNPERTKRKLIVRLERMGFDVILGTRLPPPFPRRPQCLWASLRRGDEGQSVGEGGGQSLRPWWPPKYQPVGSRRLQACRAGWPIGRPVVLRALIAAAAALAERAGMH